MKKIDSDAFNRKIYDKILELNNLVKKISPENIKLFDADLINSAENYTKVLKECSWDGDSNFNGIEMHKIKDLIFDLKANNKTRFHVVREISPQMGDYFDKESGTGIYNLGTSVDLPKLFDGRKSIVFPAVMISRRKDSHSDYFYYWRERIGYDHVITTGGNLKVFKRASAIDVSMSMGIPVKHRVFLDVIAILWR